MQIVGYDRTPDPALVIADSEDIDRVHLGRDETIDFPLGERHCAGMVDEDGHRPCDRPNVPWCPEHSETWICARCRGTCLKDVMDCHQQHVVYLAIVAPAAIKVGVTKAARIERRLNEQGADRGAVIHEVENGRIAREIETQIGEELPERISTLDKRQGLTRRIDESRWRAILEEHEPMAEYEPTYDLDLDAQPIPETLASGRVRGVKGRLLVLEHGGSTYVTDLRDLVGYRLTGNARGPELQVGLAAFE